MANRAKIAFSLAPESLASVERLRARTGESRSAVIGRAIELLTESDRKVARVARYVRSYREHDGMLTAWTSRRRTRDPGPANG